MSSREAQRVGEGVAELLRQMTTSSVESDESLEAGNRVYEPAEALVPPAFQQWALAHVPELRLRDVLANGADGRGYFLTGGVGTGKSVAAAAILRTWAEGRVADIRAGPDWLKVAPAISARWVVVPDLLREIRRTFNRDWRGPSEDEIVREYAGFRCLVMDDLGAEKISDWSVSCLYAIISRRLNYLRPTVITSNATLAQINAWEPRIASRLGAMEVLTFSGPDRRLQRGGAQ